MKNLLKTIIILILPLILCFGFFAPQQTFAQENLFDTLDDIKTGVSQKQDRVGADGKKETVEVKVVDFSTAKPWGNLPDKVTKVFSSTYKSLDELATAAKYSRAKRNISDLEKYLKDEYSDSLTSSEIQLIINEIKYKGESQIQSTILSVAKVMRNLIGGLAIIFIVISGIMMIVAGGDETKITEQKQSITYATVGLVAILLIERLIDLIYGTPGSVATLATSGKGVSEELYGVIAYAKAVIGSVAILMIMISGFKTITAQGEEDQITKQRKSVLYVIIGIVVIIVNKVFVDNLYIKPIADKLKASDPNAVEVITVSNVQAVINQIGTIIQFALGFVGIIAFAALIYGAGLLVANMGEDEAKEKAKKIIKNAIIGIVITLSAYALIATVITFK